MLFNILASVSVLLMITFLRKLVTLFPSLFACMLRWKENVNLESSVKLSYDRNLLAAILIVPFCLTVERFCLYEPSFIAKMDEKIRIGVIFGVFLGYFIIRAVASGIALAYTEKKKAYSPAAKSAYTFFIMLALILLTMGGNPLFLSY